MSTLSNEEKISIIDQHIKSLNYLKYNAELDLIENNAVLPVDSAAIQEINNRITTIETKIDVLNSEKTSLEE